MLHGHRRRILKRYRAAKRDWQAGLRPPRYDTERSRERGFYTFPHLPRFLSRGLAFVVMPFGHLRPIVLSGDSLLFAGRVAVSIRLLGASAPSFFHLVCGVFFRGA